MTIAVTNAINESIVMDADVYMEEPTAEDLADLKAEADDYEQDGPYIDFWGTTCDGESWRVHARGGRTDDGL